MKIIATFIPQYVDRVSGDIYNMDEEHWQEVDVTKAIRALGRTAALDVEDDQYSSDDLIPAEIIAAHGGPFAVRAEHAISCYYDNYTILDEIRDATRP